MLEEITFKDAKERALSGETGILITMPQPMERLTIEEISNLEKAGARCLAENAENDHG